jgi:hypothetical protein
MELGINLLWGDTSDPACRQLPERFYTKFTVPTKARPDSGAYTRRCSIMVLPPTFDEYWLAPSSYWLRQRVRRAVNRRPDSRPTGGSVLTRRLATRPPSTT